MAEQIKTCRQGHALTEDNLYRFKNGRTRCKTCANQYGREYAKLERSLGIPNARRQAKRQREGREKQNGGRVTYNKYGSEHFREIGRRGAATNKANRAAQS